MRVLVTGSAGFIGFHLCNFLIIMARYLKKPFKEINGIFSYSITDEETKKVTDFYKITPFPNYKNDDNTVKVSN